MLKRKILKAIVSVLKSSTMHGLPNIIKCNLKINKIMWTIVTLISGSFCMYLNVRTVLDYLKYYRETRLETIYEQPAPFFTVQFCSRDLKSFNNKTLKILLNQCSFGYDTKCYESPEAYFESFYDPTYRQCFRFNSGKDLNGFSISILNSTIGGKDDSFVMEIYAPKGLVFWIHNYTSPPRRQYKNNHNGDIQYASAGFETQVVVDRTFEYKLEYPYNDCLKDPTNFQFNKRIINYMIYNDIPYSQVNCLELCFDMQYLIDNPCNCTNASLGNVWDICYGR